MKSSFLVLVTLIFLSSCSLFSKSLTDDPSLSIGKANFPSLDIMLKSKHHNGLAITEVVAGTNLNSLGLQVQGYFTGLIKINSVNCKLDETISYGNNMLVNLDYDREITDPCVIDIVLSVNYPNEKDQSVKSYPFKGRVYIFPIDEGIAFNFVRKIPTNGKAIIEIPYTDKTGKLYVRGCGELLDKQKINIVNGKAVINLYAINHPEMKNCVYNMVLIGDQDYEHIRVGVAIFDEKFRTLATPQVSFKKLGFVTITGEKIVAAIGTGREFKIGNELESKVSDGQIITLMSVKGRLIFGEIRGKGITWKF